MGKAPGYQRRPEHRISEQPVSERLRAIWDGEVIADSTDVTRVEEAHHRTRYYFPPSDVRMDRLEKTEKTTECPFKGTATYFTITTGRKQFVNGAWTYENPYDEHAGLTDRIAFYDEKEPDFEIQRGDE